MNSEDSIQGAVVRRNCEEGRVKVLIGYKTDILSDSTGGSWSKGTVKRGTVKVVSKGRMKVFLL